MTNELAALYQAYLESKKNSWSAGTLRGERYRLNGIELADLQDPKQLNEKLKTHKPYSKKTIFVRAGEFVDFLMEQGTLPEGRNQIKAYMKENANNFKHAYAKRHLDVTFEEAAKRIETMEDEAAKRKAKELLYTGMRYDESKSLKDGLVLGKGGWHREVPLAEGMEPHGYTKSYHTLYRALKKIGLTSHMLRKLCATKLAELGASEADLMKLFGWRSSQMASIYTQAVREKQLTKALRDHLKEQKDGK